MKEYRIREQNGKYIIQVKVKKKLLSWLLKRDICEWKYANTNGTPLEEDGFTPQSYYSFNNLYSAKEKIKQFKKGVKYYY